MTVDKGATGYEAIASTAVAEWWIGTVDGGVAESRDNVKVSMAEEGAAGMAGGMEAGAGPVVKDDDGVVEAMVARTGADAEGEAEAAVTDTG